MSSIPMLQYSYKYHLQGMESSERVCILKMILPLESKSTLAKKVLSMSIPSYSDLFKTVLFPILNHTCSLQLVAEGGQPGTSNWEGDFVHVYICTSW